MKIKKVIPLKVRRIGIKKFHKHASHSCSMTLTENANGDNRSRSK
jgi:hypothetical protein